MPTHDTTEKKDFRAGIGVSSAIDPATPTNSTYVAPGYARSVKREALEAAERLSWHEHRPGIQSIDYQTRTSADAKSATRTVYYWQLARATFTSSDGTQIEIIYFLTKDSGLIGSILSNAEGDRRLTLKVNLQEVNVEVLKMLLFALTRLG